jgi:hypothetical protein
VIGLHPDQVTDSIVEAALKYSKPFAVVPCCVFPYLFPHRRLLLLHNTVDLSRPQHLHLRTVKAPKLSHLLRNLNHLLRLDLQKHHHHHHHHHQTRNSRRSPRFGRSLPSHLTVEPDWAISAKDKQLFWDAVAAGAQPSTYTASAQACGSFCVCFSIFPASNICSVFERAYLFFLSFQCVSEKRLVITTLSWRELLT